MESFQRKKDPLSLNEQEIIKYVSSFDMKLSVVLFKIQLNSLLSRHRYNTSSDFFVEINERLRATYEEYKSRFNLDLLDALTIEKINLNIFYQNAPYREYLDETYLRNFEIDSLKQLISELHSSEVLTKIMEDFCREELEEVENYSKYDLNMLKEKAAKFFIGNILNLYKIKDLENDLIHSKYIMKYQQQKIKQLQAESKSNEMKYLEEKEKTATLLQFIENNSLIKKELN